MTEAKRTAAKQEADKLKALRGTIMTADGQVVQITTKPAPTPKGVPDPVVNAKTRKRHKQALNAFLTTDEVVKEQVGGFVNFIREKAVVGLAVGFVVGTQAQTVVKQLVTSFIDPVIQLMIGGAKLSERHFSLSLFGNSAEFAWGAMIYALLNLLVVLLTIYILIKALKLDKLDKPNN